MFSRDLTGEDHDGPDDQDDMIKMKMKMKVIQCDGSYNGQRSDYL